MYIVFIYVISFVSSMEVGGGGGLQSIMTGDWFVVFLTEVYAILEQTFNSIIFVLVFW